MPDQSYRTFLANLEQQGELIRFDKEVDPAANMAAVEWKAYNELGKASLFTNLKGHENWQATSQILSDRRKWAIGLNVDESVILDEISNRLRQTVPTVDVGAGNAPVQEVVFEGDDVNILDIPAMMTSEEDGGRYFASGMAIVKDPKTGIRNMSVHRQMVLNERETGFIMVPR
ncbi:MAG: UbiD family decarboxylase, partial [Alphaproteobacteria bacterium]